MDDTLNPPGEEQLPVREEPKYENLSFTGDGTEFFMIWIVNLLLKAVTLGVFSAWAKVRERKYVYSKIKFRGHSLDFHGKPLNILVGRIIGIFLFTIYFILTSIHPLTSIIGLVMFVICMPFFFVKSLQFNINNTSYQNIRFHYLGKGIDALKLYFKYFTFPVITSIAMLAAVGFLSPTEVGAKPSEENALIILAIIFGVSLINFIYTLVVASPATNALFQFVYNNVYFGGSRFQLFSSPETVGKNVVKPIVLLYIGAIVGGIAMMVVVSALMAVHPIFAIIVPFCVIGFYLFMLYISLRIPYLVIDYIWNRLSLEEEGHFKSDMEWWAYFKVGLVNFFLVGLSLGIYRPWAQMDMLSLKLNSRRLKMGSLETVVATAKSKEAAIGEEIGDAFDFDFEIGV